MRDNLLVVNRQQQYYKANRDVAVQSCSIGFHAVQRGGDFNAIFESSAPACSRHIPTLRLRFVETLIRKCEQFGDVVPCSERLLRRWRDRPQCLLHVLEPHFLHFQA